MNSRFQAPGHLTRQFMLAARQHELQALAALAQTGDLVVLVGQLVHALQKERGYSNMLLCSRNDQALEMLDALSDAARQQQMRLEQVLRNVARSPTPAWHNARLLNACAHALLRLDEAPVLRQRIRARSIPGTEASAHFNRLIASLLAMVAEAMDGAPDPGITQQLVALLNFMQGKELCGQERAHGVSAFAAGHWSEGHQLTLIGLQQAQERSFALFRQHTTPAMQARWDHLREDETTLQRLRLLGQQSHPGQPLDAGMVTLWFDVCTARIDAMHALETELAAQLVASCTERMARSSQELENLPLLTQRFLAQYGMDAEKPAVLYSLQGRPLDQSGPDPLGEGLSRSLLDLLHAQAQRLHEADQALLVARRGLQERRLIEQVKWQLVSRYGISEPEAHERMQRTAMHRGMSLYEVSEWLRKEL